MEKQKTPIQRLLEKYVRQWEKYGMGSVISYSALIDDLEELFEVEKKQKISDFLDGKKEGVFIPKVNKKKPIFSKDWYNEKYGENGK